ncbi:MAG TPA: hypothetical protein VIJ18_02490 [Microbacteriaceae bacterium]
MPTEPLTGSVTAVGVTVAMRFAPTLFFGLHCGIIADRYRKRPLLIATQSLGRSSPQHSRC